MRVYYPGGRRNHTTFVTPAADVEGIRGGVDSEWLDDEGHPKMITVNFVNGSAEVSDALGRYLVARRYAKRTSLILPRGVAA